MEILTEIQYLPPVSYFVRLGAFEGLILEGQEHYQKQSYRNRCYILGANKVTELNIPVRKTGQKMLIRDAEIDYNQKWLPVHWRTISSAYGKAPFFEYYEELFRQIFFKKHKFLFDLNMELLQLVLKLIDWKKGVRISECYIDPENIEADYVFDGRNKVHPKFQEQEEEIRLARYTQLFGKDFVENLSIIDLLFCEGPESSQILNKCQIVGMNN